MYLLVYLHIYVYYVIIVLSVYMNHKKLLPGLVGSLESSSVCAKNDFRTFKQSSDL